jgi:hypothetical protein
MIKTVKEVKVIKTGVNKKGQWTMLSVIFTDGTKASTFDKALENKAGCLVDVETEQDGDFTNLKSWILAGPVPTAPAAPQTLPAPIKPVDSTPAPINKPDPHNKSFALAYAKDVTVAEIAAGIKFTDLGVIGEQTVMLAKVFETYLNG